MSKPSEEVKAAAIRAASSIVLEKMNLTGDATVLQIAEETARIAYVICAFFQHIEKEEGYKE